MNPAVEHRRRLRWRQKKHGGKQTPEALIALTGSRHATLARLAAYLGVARSTLSDLFANKRDMRTSFTRRVANAINVDVDTMMTMIERYTRRDASQHDMTRDAADDDDDDDDAT